MLLIDANDMIAENRKSVAALSRIADRMANEGKFINIEGHRGAVGDQQDISNFGVFFYGKNAADYDMRDNLRENRSVFNAQVSALSTTLAQNFEDKCDKTITRYFPKKTGKGE